MERRRKQGFCNCALSNRSMRIPVERSCNIDAGRLLILSMERGCMIHSDGVKNVSKLSRKLLNGIPLVKVKGKEMGGDNYKLCFFLTIKWTFSTKKTLKGQKSEEELFFTRKLKLRQKKFLKFEKNCLF